MTAKITSPTPNPLPVMTGKNFAPAKPLEDLSKNKTPDKNTICEAMLIKYQDYKERDVQAWQEWYDIGRMVANSRNGKLLMLRHAFDNRVLFKKRDSRFQDAKTVGGAFQFYCTKLLAEWLSSRPDLDPIIPSNNDQVEEFISKVKIVWDSYNTKFFDTAYESEECLSAQDFGTWITRFRYDEDVKDIVCELLDFPACKWDMRFTAEESSWFIYESKCANSVLKHWLKGDIPEDGDSYENYGLQVVEQITRQGGNVDGQGQGRTRGEYNIVNDETVVTQMWLQPEAYCDIELSAPVKTLSGGTISGNLLEQFPNGLVVVAINGMKTIIGIYAENHKEHIVSGRYHLQSYCGIGKGISDAVDVKKEMDDLHSQTMAYIKAHGTPSYTYNSDMISEQHVRNIGKPRTAIPIDFTNAPDGVNNVNQVVQPITPGNPAAAVFEYADKLNNWLQIAMQVTDFTNGLPGVDNKTATGAQIGDANAQMVLVPQHLNKADHRKRSAIVIYNLFRKFVDAPKWFRTRDTNGITAGMYLSGHDFDDVPIDFEIVANSEVPKTPYAQEASLTRLLPLTGGLQGLEQSMMTNPDLTSEVVSAFGVKLKIPTQKNIARVCRQRIEQAKKLLEKEMQLQQVQGAIAKAMGDPELMPDNADMPMAIVSQLTPPINAREPYHALKIQWLSDLLDNDEMMFASDELRDIICAMIDTHIEQDVLGQAYNAQSANMANIMANLPQLVGEDIMNRQNQMLMQNFQQQQVQQQQQMEMEKKAQEAQISDTQANAEHERQLALSDRSHKQQLQLNAMNILAKEGEKQAA